MGRKKRPAAAMAQTLPVQPPIPPPFPFHGAPTVPHGLPPAMPTMPVVPPPPPMPPGAAAAASISSSSSSSMYPPVAPPMAPPPSSTLSFALPNEPARKKLDTGAEKLKSFLVKKYRPEKPFRCIEAFQRYTKSHRMTDATFQQISPPNRGATASAPIVFCARIGGSDLSWGRGRTQDIAIDNACRAAFALVAAHGYTDFDCNEDCLTQEPFELYVPETVLPPKGPWNGGGPPVPPPPLPPPPPTGLVPPPPVPLPAGVHVGGGGGGVTLIPQAKTMSHQLAVPTFVNANKESSVGVGVSLSSTSAAGATAGTSANASAVSSSSVLKNPIESVSGTNGKATGEMPTLSMSLKQQQQQQQQSGSSTMKATPFQSTIKGGLTLLFDPTVSSVNNDRNDQDFTMEMKRACLRKYRDVVLESWKRQGKTV